MSFTDDQQADKAASARKPNAARRKAIPIPKTVDPSMLTPIVLENYKKQATRDQSVMVTLIDPDRKLWRVNFWEGSIGGSRVGRSLVCQLKHAAQIHDATHYDIIEIH